MRKLTFIYLFLLSFVSFSQNLGNPAVIGQSSRNQKVGKGFQIEDTLLAKGKVRFSVVSVGSTKDTFVTVVDTAGYVSKVGKSTFLSGVIDSIYYKRTIAQLRIAMAAKTLKKGSLYQATDFQTIYDQPDFNSDGSPKAVVATKTGSIEHLVFTATSDSTFDTHVSSIQFPLDKIEFDFSFTATEIMAAPAKGRISYREDINGNNADFDFRKVLLLSYESAPASGEFNQWKDNGGASIETLCFGNNYGVAFIGGNTIGGFKGQLSFAGVFGYPFYICNVVINAQTSAIGNNIGTISRNCRFGDNLSGADLNSAYNIIAGNDVRNFKNTGNISNVILGNNNNSLNFMTAVVGFTMGDGNTNMHFKHSIGNVVIGDDNQNWECDSELQNISADNDLSNINNLYISNYIDGSGWFNFITTITHPELYTGRNKKEILLASNGDAYTRYFNGTTDVITIID